MDVDIIFSVGDWAAAVARLPTVGPLPRRTALVPHGRAAHALRRELVRAGLAVSLPGTEIVPTSFAAMEVLRSGGVEFTPGEEQFRRARLAALLRSFGPLRHFPLDLLQTALGWDEALAATIGDLEGAGLRPSDLEFAAASDRLLDLAAIWRALDDSAGVSWTTARAMFEGARLLEQTPAVWPFVGPTLAFVGTGVSAIEARLVRAIPGIALGLAAARPLRDSYTRRVRALFGDAAADATTAATVPRLAGSERNLLASFLFEPPLVLAAPARPKSEGPDGSVDIEEHAGIESEIEAASVWVARQIAAGCPLEDIAILAPESDPIAGLIAERLARLPWPSAGGLPVHVEGGLPLTGTATGARGLAVVRALAGHLSTTVLADVLPVLRCEGATRHLSRGAAMDLAWSLGTVGGNAAFPAGALEWSERARARETDLSCALNLVRAAESADGSGHRTRDIERLLDDLRAVRPALEALVDVSRLLVSGARLEALWPVLREFFGAFVLQPGREVDLGAHLDETLAPLIADSRCRELAGADALAVVERALTSTRVAPGRFGDPAVYVGTVAGALGLTFSAVRVVGLSEGHLPSVGREDPVLPDRERRALEAALAIPAGLPTVGDRALAQLHAFDFVVRNATAHIALSASRLDVTRSERESSSVILEAAAAIGRPHPATGRHGAAIPDGTALRRDFFVPARQAAAAFRRERPIGEAAWQDGVSRRQFSTPPGWHSQPAVDLDRIRRLMAGGAASALDGLLGSGALGVGIPGLAADRPISPSRLETLLHCPHAFLLEHVLGFGEPASAPPQREIGQPFYGSLFHEVAAAFYQSCGPSFCAGEGTLDAWLNRADAIVDEAFEQFLRQYPLAGSAVRGQQRDRLRRDMRDFVQYDWALAAAGRRFVTVEHPFGHDVPIELPLSGGRTLFVRGRIDRIDSDGRTTLVRDLKTGRPHGRTGKEAGPTASIDLQIAVYGMVARARAADWQIPSNVGAAYVYLSRGRSDERSYRDDFHQVLEPAARVWLDLAGGLLSAGLFPQTPHSDDCQYCAFRPVCGDRASERARSLLDAAVDDTMTTGDAEEVRALRAFAELKGVAPSDSEDD